jgi:predicted nucleic acid-binding protein
MWLRDTNVVSEPSKRSPSHLVMAWVRAQDAATLYTHALAIAEIRAGIARVADPDVQAGLTGWLDSRVRPLSEGRTLETDEALWLTMLRVIARGKAAGRHVLVVVTRDVRGFAGTAVRLLNPWLPDPSAGVA